MDKYPKTDPEANDDSTPETEKQTTGGLVPTGGTEIQRYREDTEYESSRGYREPSLGEFLSWACGESRKVADEAKETGRWQTTTFHFVRLCHSRKEFQGMTPAEFYELVPWHSTDFDENEILTAMVEFGKVKTAPTQDKLVSALWLASELPVVEGGRFFHMKSFNLFLNVAYHLQRLQREDPVYFPCHRMADLLAVTPLRISQYRQTAKIYGYLKEVAPHTKKRATRFRVNLDAFPKIKDMH